MSWKNYVDDNLVGSGKISKAAILGLKGGVWAKSDGFDITPEEQKLITSAFANSEAPKADAKQPEEEHSKARDAILSHGVHLAGVKYFTVSITGRTIQVRKGLNGAVIVKTEQAVLVALYEEPIQAPEASGVVEPLADYLISQKY